MECPRVVMLRRSGAILLAFRALQAYRSLTGGSEGWAPLHRLYNAVWKHAGGILQADGEGFCNEDGFTILWQFSDTVSGEWNMGVLKDGRWVHFEMDLGNERHRNEFLSGQVPLGAKLV